MVHLANGTVALLYRDSRGDEEAVVINPTVLINFPNSINLINLFVSPCDQRPARELKGLRITNRRGKARTSTPGSRHEPGQKRGHLLAAAADPFCPGLYLKPGQIVLTNRNKWDADFGTTWPDF